MATIKIQRMSESLHIFRDYQIYIDGQKVGEIANGDSMHFDVTNGRYIIYAKIGRGRSPQITIDINDDNSKSLKVGGYGNGMWILRVFSVLMVLLFLPKGLLNIDYGKCLIWPMIILIIYYITFGRERYLTLKEIW